MGESGRPAEDDRSAGPALHDHLGPEKESEARSVGPNICQLRHARPESLTPPGPMNGVLPQPDLLTHPIQLKKEQKSRRATTAGPPLPPQDPGPPHNCSPITSARSLSTPHAPSVTSGRNWPDIKLDIPSLSLSPSTKPGYIPGGWVYTRPGFLPGKQRYLKLEACTRTSP